MFNAGIQADLAWLVIIGVLNSVISAYYYLAVVRQMFLGEAEERAEAAHLAHGGAGAWAWPPSA